MKRHIKLIELSREHHHSLSLCLKILKHPELNYEQDIKKHITELIDHFNREEHQFNTLWEKINRPELKQQFESDHFKLRELFQNAQFNSKEWNISFAETLRNHARFEERELFPVLETVLD